MHCPVCHQEMKKVRQTVTSNQETGAAYRAYDSVTYHCEADDAWVNVELPVANNEKSGND